VLGGLYGVGPMTDVAASGEAVVTTDGTCNYNQLQSSEAEEKGHLPTAEAKGLVAPSMARPVLTASSP
jgi:hypothetical protein